MGETKPAKLKAYSSCYRNVDEVWMFTVKDADIKDDNGRIPLSEKSKLLNIVAYSSKENPIEPKEVDTGKKSNKKKNN